MRHLTRGVGERTQIKNIRTTDYPQVGLTESIIPNAVNTSIVGTNITAIRVESNHQPMLINSGFAFFGSQTNSLNIHFLGMKKGENGYGIGFANNNTTAVSAVNKAIGCSYLNNRIVAIKTNQVSINSWGTIPAINTQNWIFSNNNVNLVFSETSTARVIENRDTRRLDDLNQNAFEVRKGGVKNVVSQNRNGKIFDRIAFKDKASTSITLSPYTVLRNIFHHDYRLSGVEPYGTLTYSETNTNQNNNAAWLLNQRTQYQRKFNPLKNLGV